MEVSIEKRLFIIANTTHYLIIKNYIRNKPPAINYLILTIREFEGYKEFCKRVEKDKDFDLLGLIFTNTRNTFPLNYVDIFSEIIKIKRLLRNKKNFNEVLFTNYRSWIQHYILKTSKPGKIILVSDGASIFIHAKIRMQDKSIPFAGSRFFIDKVLGLKPLPHVHFYSPVKLQVPGSDSLEQFNLANSPSSTLSKNKIYFVGSPLVEAGYLDRSTYLLYLRKIKNNFDDQEIIYLAHRREKDENLSFYDFFGERMRDNFPFEERMQKEAQLPGKVLSFFSSILIYLPPHYPQIQFYYVPIRHQDIPNDNSLRERYQVIEKNLMSLESSNLSRLSITTEKQK